MGGSFNESTCAWGVGGLLPGGHARSACAAGVGGLPLWGCGGLLRECVCLLFSPSFFLLMLHDLRPGAGAHIGLLLLPKLFVSASLVFVDAACRSMRCLP